MSYTKHNYKKGDELLASQLNDMDDQIALNEQTADTLVTVSNTQPAAAKNRVWVKATPSEIEIPTMDDHNELSRQLSDSLNDQEYLPDWVGGWIEPSNGTNNNNYPTVRIRTDNYIDLSVGLTLEFVGEKTVRINGVLYDENKNYLGAYFNNAYIATDAAKKVYTQEDFTANYKTAKYIRFAFAIYPEQTITPEEAEDWIVMHTGVLYGPTLVLEKGVEVNNTNIGKISNSEKGFIHISYASTVRTTVNQDGTVTVIFGHGITTVFNSSYRVDLAWSDISSNIASYITISGNSASINIPVYRSLVLNLDDLKLYMRSNNIADNDFVIIRNGTYAPQGWAIDLENYQLRFTSDTVLDREGTSKYETFTQSVLQEQCQKFAVSLLNVEHSEAFLFYTDPHIMGSLYTVNKLNTYQVFNSVLKYFQATPTDFILCGGDWLDNSDTPEQAAFKLGFIKGTVKNAAPTYLLVGNHDTNYQGTERLSGQSLKNLWYNGESTYYRFKGRETAFYCFDTGTENQALSAQDNLGYEQAVWFATSLLTESEAHTVICMHILYYTLSPLSIQPLAQTILDIAKAYNDRGTITVNGQTFDFGSATGKVELLIAGHTHVDGTYTVNGIPCVVTRNTWIPGNSTWAFDLVSIDYDNRKVNLIRAGTNGTDRTVNLA